MLDNVSDFPALADKFCSLRAADRRAVLARFSPAERRAFERRLTAQIEEQRRKLEEERRAELQFACYSAPLATKVERAVRGETTSQPQLTKACAASLVRTHNAITQSPEATGLAGFLRKFAWLPPLLSDRARK